MNNNDLEYLFYQGIGRLEPVATQGEQIIIPTVAVEQIYHPLSSSQRRLWMLSHFEKSHLVYHIPVVYELKGAVNEEVFSDSFSTLIERNETLRIVFTENANGELYQVVLPVSSSGYELEYKDLRWEVTGKSFIDELINSRLAKRFELNNGPLMRASLYRVAEDRWIFCLVIHQLICDESSAVLFMEELLACYETLVNVGANYMPQLRIQFKDYASWQHTQLKSGALQTDKEYWLDQLSGELPALALMSDQTRPHNKTYNGGCVNKTLDSTIVTAFRTLVNNEKSTIFNGLFAAVTVLLHRYTNQTDILIGMPVNSRAYPDLARQIGPYTNILPLRVQFSESDDYRSVLTKAVQIQTNGYQHHQYPFEELINELNLPRDTSRSALFDVLIEYHSANNDLLSHETRTCGLIVRPYTIDDYKVVKFDLTFHFIDLPEGLTLLLEYNSDLFSRESIERMQDHFETLLSSIISAPRLPVSQLMFLSVSEKQQLLQVFNNTAIKFPKHQSILELFEKQVLENPEKTAIEFGDTILTYKKLDERTTWLAAYLKENCGITQDDLVGVLLDRSDLAIIAILGILKSGGAYVPVETDYPKERLEFIIQDTGMKVLVTQSDYLFDVNYFQGKVFAIDIQLDTLSKSEKLHTTVSNDGLAYVIYTSGSSGKPKGCGITHGNLYNYVCWANDYYFSDQAETNFGLFTSLAFDLTVTSIFCTLTTGGKLVIYNQHQDLFTVLYDNFSGNFAINSIKLTPSHIRLLQEVEFKSSKIQKAIVGGEVVSQEHLKILKKINPTIEIYNEYGPSETTVGCIVKKLNLGEPIQIGRPIFNTQIYILSNCGSLTPMGVIGEICIGGKGVGRGYVNRQALTAERFVTNPFNPESLMYKTGDLGRWLPDGNIEFLGRKDDQVKINGYRIELGEIESVLKGFPGIVDSVAIVRSVGDDKQLVAYVVGEEKLTATELRCYLSTMLPAYMIPTQYVQLDSFPLTINGKVDKKSLPDTKGQSLLSSTEYIAPGNATEEVLADIWSQVLGLEKTRISAQDRFFDIGGHSLLAMRTGSAIKKEFGLNISLEALFKYTTITDLSNYIQILKPLENFTESDFESIDI